MSQDATIALLLPTRFRAASAVEALRSVAATVARPDLLRVVVGIDDDDAESAEAIRTLCMPYALTQDVGHGARGLNHRVHLMLPAARGCAIVGFFADDVRMATSGWDVTARKAVAMMPGGHGVAYFKDPLHPMFPSYPIVTAAMIDELGFLFEPHAPYWFSDSWLYEIGSMIGCLLPLDAALANPHGKGQTRHLRELPFWADWFDATRPQRMVVAQRLIHRMYPAQPALITTLENDLPGRAHWLQLQMARFKDPAFLRQMESFSMESGEPPEAYLAAKRLAIEHLRKMRAELGIRIEDQFSPSPDPSRKDGTG